MSLYYSISVLLILLHNILKHFTSQGRLQCIVNFTQDSCITWDRVWLHYCLLRLHMSFFFFFWDYICLKDICMGTRLTWGWTCTGSFMCQLDQDTGCPNIFLNIFSRCVCEEMFLDEVSIWFSRLSNVNCPLQCGLALYSTLRDWIYHTGSVSLESSD